jgi:hypothetical protein
MISGGCPLAKTIITALVIRLKDLKGQLLSNTLPPLQWMELDYWRLQKAQEETAEDLT